MERLLVVGNGMASVRFLEHLTETNDHGFEITVLSADPVPGYNRIMLSPLLAGELDASGIQLRPARWYVDNGIQLHCGEAGRAVKIDRSEQRVIIANGQTHTYDKLVLATGSRPFIPDLPGKDLKGVMGFRTLEDVEAMLSTSKGGRRAIVVGGGLLGLEAACALQSQGVQTTVVHSRSVLMNRQLDATAGHLLHQSLIKKGVDFRLESRTVAITGEHGHVTGVNLQSGETLPADIVIFTAGITPNTALMHAAGLPCNRGMLVNTCLQTEDQNIYGLGECTEVEGQTFGLVEPVYQQAKVLSDVLRKKLSPGFKPTDTATRLKVTGIDLFSLGDIEGTTPDNPTDKYSNDELVLNSPSQGVYRKLIIRNNQLKGILLYGDVTDANWYQELYENQNNIKDIKQTMIFGKTYTNQAA